MQTKNYFTLKWIFEEINCEINGNEKEFECFVESIERKGKNNFGKILSYQNKQMHVEYSRRKIKNSCRKDEIFRQKIEGNKKQRSLTKFVEKREWKSIVWRENKKAERAVERSQQQIQKYGDGLQKSKKLKLKIDELTKRYEGKDDSKLVEEKTKGKDKKWTWQPRTINNPQ